MLAGVAVQAGNSVKAGVIHGRWQAACACGNMAPTNRVFQLHVQITEQGVATIHQEWLHQCSLVQAVNNGPHASTQTGSIAGSGIGHQNVAGVVNRLPYQVVQAGRCWSNREGHVRTAVRGTWYHRATTHTNGYQ